jgi:5-methylcytosine-specific restriction endonuclease McrA
MFRKYKCRSNIPKRYLIERDGHKCAICGLSEWNGEKAPLVVDHIDGDHDNMNINNFRLLCPNCDAQTPHYKGKNRGRGRQYRRERYQQGLSY